MRRKEHRINSVAFICISGLFLSGCKDSSSLNLPLRERVRFGFSIANVEEIVGEEIAVKESLLFHDEELQAKYPLEEYYHSRPIYVDESGRQVMYQFFFSKEKKLIKITTLERPVGTVSKEEIEELKILYK